MPIHFQAVLIFTWDVEIALTNNSENNIFLIQFFSTAAALASSFFFHFFFFFNLLFSHSGLGSFPLYGKQQTGNVMLVLQCNDVLTLFFTTLKAYLGFALNCGT